MNESEERRDRVLKQITKVLDDSRWGTWPGKAIMEILDAEVKLSQQEQVAAFRRELTGVLDRQPPYPKETNPVDQRAPTPPWPQDNPAPTTLTGVKEWEEKQRSTGATALDTWGAKPQVAAQGYQQGVDEGLQEKAFVNRWRSIHALVRDHGWCVKFYQEHSGYWVLEATVGPVGSLFIRQWRAFTLTELFEQVNGFTGVDTFY